MIILGNRPIAKVYQGSTLYRRIYFGSAMIHPGVIRFEDSNVKSICVSNWGGNIVPNEITTEEAAAVTSLNGAFYGNTSITKFNELRFFTGLTSLYRKNENSYATGELYNCNNLTEVTLPSAPIDNQAGAFRGCSKLVSVDLSPITGTKLQLSNICRNCSSLVTLKLKGGVYQSISGRTIGSNYAFYSCGSLTTIAIDGTADWSKLTNVAAAFNYCDNLENISGVIYGLGTSFSNGTNITLSSCSKLTRESLLAIINGLANVTGSHDLILHDDAYARLLPSDIAIAVNKGWTVNGGGVPSQSYQDYVLSGGGQLILSDDKVFQVIETT